MLNHTRTKNPQLKQQPSIPAFSTIRRGASWLMLAIIFYFAAATTAQAAPGDLDTTWGGSGIVVTPFEESLEGNVSYLLHTQPDGKVIFSGLVVDYSIFSFITRYNVNGTLDTTFGTNGIILYSGGSEFYYSPVVQPDGKIVAAGHKAGDLAVARYNSDGTLDATFGTGGKVVTPLGGIYGVGDTLLQPDGKIVVGAYRRIAPNYQFNFLFVRYNPNGTLDTTFGIDGKVTIGFLGYRKVSAALQPDGKIVFGGTIILPNYDFALLRLLPDGSSFDPTFGAGGIVTTPSSSDDHLYDIALQADGKIIASGILYVYGSNPAPLIRYNQNGSLDTTFARVPFSFYVSGKAIAVQPNGKIIAAGGYTIARFNADGSPDATFGTNGIVLTPITTHLQGEGHAVALQSDGKIVATGVRIGTNNSAIVRYIGDSPSTPRTRFDFDGDGKADVAVFRPSNGTWYLQQSQAGFTGVAFGQADDKITPADYDGDGKTDVAVYRGGTWYLQRSNAGFTGIAFGAATDIPVPADYDGDGRAELAVYRPSNGTWYIYNLANNQISGIAFGASEDKPVPADYDGDGKTDVAVFRPSNGTWYLQRSQLGFTGIQFGASEDKPVPADYDSDSKADVAVFRPSNGTWYLQRSMAGLTSIQFGLETDVPVPADYDGDGKADVAVFRNGTWYLQRSASGFSAVPFGSDSDVPIPSVYLP